MADYKYLQDQTTTTLGVIHKDSGAVIPNYPGNAAWDAFVASGQTPDPATATAVADYRVKVLHELDRQAEDKLAIALRLRNKRSPGMAAVHLAMYAEARRYNLDLAPIAATYPILDGLDASDGANLAAKAVTINAEFDAGIGAAIAAINKARREGVKAIQAAGTLAAVDAALAAVSFP